MASDSPSTSDTNAGFPPVEPPSGKLLAQLFLVPGLIVAGVVVLLLFFNWLVSGPRNPESFLRKLDDANSEVRWRSAADLSQVLLRDDRLASDPAFALALAQRLDRARAGSAEVEAAFAERAGKLSPEEFRKEQAKLEQERNYINYLSACLGNFMVPVGAPLLEQLATQDKGLEPKALATRRRDAMWALAKLGDNLRRFDKLPSAQQEAILAALGDVQSLPREQAAWADAARKCLQTRLDGRPDLMGMATVLELCSTADDPYLREITGFASNFWKGDAPAEARIEEMLVRLSHDSGQGEDMLAAWAAEEKPDSQAVTKAPGLKVRMNATVALARRGSSKVRLDLLQEMLDETRLREAFVIRAKDGTETPDEATIDETLQQTLKTVADLRRKRPDLAMPGIQAAVDRLADHPNAAVRSAAKEAQLALKG